MPSIRDLAKARVVVVGDALLDIWIHGTIDRISPEAPIPVFKELRRESRDGGAHNAVANLRALGCTVPDVWWDWNRPEKTRFVVNNQQVGLRYDVEENLRLSRVAEDYIIDCVATQNCDVLIISDYAKGVCTPSLCQRLIAWAKQRGVKVVVDPKGADWSKYKGADVITPNEAEFQAYGGRNSLLGFNTILVTQGARGMWLSSYGAKDVSIPAANKGPVDVCGAGDTVIAVLAAALAVGFDLEQAARLANAAAGVSVSKFGTASCSIEELETAMGERAGSLGVSEVSGPCTLKTAPLRPIVGFANGVFDCFHDGHRHFLRECKMNCDRLVVAVNGASYTPDKILHDSLNRRMRNVLEYADQADPFATEQDLLAIMRHHKPDVIFKGEDYHGKPVTGGDLARIHWVARHPGYSSTIERAKAKA